MLHMVCFSCESLDKRSSFAGNDNYFSSCVTPVMRKTLLFCNKKVTKKSWGLGDGDGGTGLGITLKKYQLFFAPFPYNLQIFLLNFPGESRKASSASC